MGNSTSQSRLRSWSSDHRGDIFSLAVIVVLALVFLSPAVKDGFAYGGYDLDLSLTSLTSGIIPTIHSPYNGDAVSQMIAWNTLDWQMIHHGQFPLWNQYSALGMPQFLNFESSVLSLPDLVSYLFPLTAAFLIVVLTKLLLAGIGVYFFARVLRLRPVGALFAGVTFMFSGAFASWVTWPLSDVAAWSGWILAFAVLCYRATGRPRHVFGLGVAIAFSVYGGFPEANVMFAFVVGALVIIAGIAMCVRRERIEIRGLGRVIAGVGSGAMLSAPLWLPGLQVISAGHRTSDGHYAGLPLRSIPTLFTQGYFGLPIGSLRSVFQLRTWNYYETVSYVGIIALALALVALFALWRRPVVLGLVGALIVALAMTYEPAGFHPIQNLLDKLGPLSAIRFERMRVFTAFVVAVLAGFGVDQLSHSWSKIQARWALFGGSVVASLFVLVAVVDTLGEHLVGAAHTERMHALLWPVVIVAVLFVVAVVGLRQVSAGFGRLMVALLCVVQFGFLFFSGVGIPTYASTVYPSSPAVVTLQKIVGNSLVGLDGGNATNVRSFSHIGFYPNVNIGYHVRIFGVHDPLVPKAYFASWPFPAAAPERFGVGLFTPDINSVALARRYGIAYVLVAPGLAAPAGMTQVAHISGERLLSVADSSQFSFLNGGRGSISAVSTDGNGNYSLRVDAVHAGQLIARFTDLPGWHVLIDNKSVVTQSYESVMFRFDVPKGQHEIAIRYWPNRLSDGLVIGLVALIFFVAEFIWLIIRRRTMRTKTSQVL